jgi:hypothetical protein
MGRNYTLPTIKILFAEASQCAHPDCSEPLVYNERGQATVVADIAHIRSESSEGPRHDPTFTGDVNGPDNLLLLCGKHHRPVDRHESLYTVEELLQWKIVQREQAGGGIPFSETDARFFTRLSQEERSVITEIARREHRVANACRRAHARIGDVRAAAEDERLKAARRMPMWYVDDEGDRTSRVSDDAYQLSEMDRRKWAQLEKDAWEAERPRAVEEWEGLTEEIAVLCMLAESLADPAERIADAAKGVIAVVGDYDEFEAAIALSKSLVAELWSIAVGETPPLA